MKHIELNGHKLEIFDDIEDMPVVNFSKFNKYLLIDAGIGSDINDIDCHIARIISLIELDKDKALAELQNMHQSICMVANEISPRNMAFATIVHSIDGEVVTDLSDEGIKRLSAKLELSSVREVNEILDNSKKKLDEELKAYFPKYFSDIKEKVANDKCKRRALLQLDEVISDADHSAEIKAIDADVLKKYKPKNFLGRDSVEIQHDKNFEQTCFVVAQKTGLDPRSMSVQQFYSLLESVEKQNKEEAKSLKRH